MQCLAGLAGLAGVPVVMDRRGEKIRRPSPQNQTCRDVAVDRPHWHAEPARIRYAWYAGGLVRNTLNLCIGSPVFHIRGPSSCTIEAPIPDDVGVRHVQRRGTVMTPYQQLARIRVSGENRRGSVKHRENPNVLRKKASRLAPSARGAKALRFEGSASC